MSVLSIVEWVIWGIVLACGPSISRRQPLLLRLADTFLAPYRQTIPAGAHPVELAPGLPSFASAAPFHFHTANNPVALLVSESFPKAQFEYSQSYRIY